MTRRPVRQVADWFDRPIHRRRFLEELEQAGDHVRVLRPNAAEREGFAVEVTLTPTSLDPQQVTIEFVPGARNRPAVYVPGPSSPHRYSDSRLCMWYPHDPPDRRWTWRDGGAALAVHICAHLVREAWWRESGEWAGEEAPHGVTPGSITSSRSNGDHGLDRA